MVLGLRSSASSVTISTEVVRGLKPVVKGFAGSGEGNAARRVGVGVGTVTVSKTVLVCSYATSETKIGGSS
jgi:hypothetical protein